MKFYAGGLELELELDTSSLTIFLCTIIVNLALVVADCGHYPDKKRMTNGFALLPAVRGVLYQLSNWSQLCTAHELDACPRDQAPVLHSALAHATMMRLLLCVSALIRGFPQSWRKWTPDTWKSFSWSARPPNGPTLRCVPE